VDAYAYSPSDVRFPYSVEIQTSIDGITFTSRGTDRHKGARYAHNNWNVDWPLYPRHDSPDWDVFPDYGLRGNYIFVPFDASVSARYVKFLVTQATGKGLMLSEVNVYDRLTVEEWTPRLTHEPSLTAPVANVDVDQITGHAPMTVRFDASGSSDPDGSIVSYVWDFGDTSSNTGASVSHTYHSAGKYAVTLTIKDDGGNESMVTTCVSVAESRQ
jgi:PKD repeat protein